MQAARYKPKAYVLIGGILVAVGQKVVSESALPAHYSAWLGIRAELALFMPAALSLT
jgi:hypothetical protein